MKRLFCMLLVTLLCIGTAFADAPEQTVPDASNVPVIPAGTLSASIVQFTSNQTYAVYSAPDSKSIRGAKGRARVSTNGWIQVFGSDGDWILVQYDITDKGRIYRYFTAYPAHTAREKGDFLKSEYGIGGHSHAVSGFDHSSENHDGKGIRLEKGNCQAIQLSWAQVAARIDTMIVHDRYMTRQELADIGALQEEEPADDPEEEPIHTEVVRERLADVGIVNGEVVDEDALRSSPFAQQVTELA